MLETFSPAARRCVESAREEAVLLRHDFLGTEHLLLGLLRQDTDPAARLLADAGLTLEDARAAVRRLLAGGGPAGVDPLDADALRSIGIDLAEVTDQVESVFGPGALAAPDPAPARTATLRVRMTGRAKQSLALALRAARASRSGRRIECAHLLLGLLREGGGLARAVLLDAGVDLASLERAAEGVA
ncbi:Clp protease N-terminal domain-containing protein [Streptacidiphilus rugosus]|uniref:Clp protease N-terminal domain-containing protein n=1 Tax=Streptacidiphilus rugosus TaxID=405783 RepID=UPI000562E469|nr:Clp protease N-terminal domain-containing protein [Streptacidiphilus rugosus]